MASHVDLSVEIPAEHARNIFGELDEHVKSIERTLNVDIIPRGDSVHIQGTPLQAAKAKRLLAQLLILSERGNTITTQNVTYALSLLMDDMEQAMGELDGDTIIHTMSGRPIKPKTIGQKKYVESIRNRMITFGIGPAGTGKTYMAMAMAVRAFRRDEVTRIILTRPAIEAGEKLGFLPGDLQSKIDPYLRPLYDALYDIMGAETFLKNSEKGLIEVAPLAYMRGRTLDNARIGFGTKVVITGDRTQKDLPRGTESGLDVAAKVLQKIDDIGFCELTSKDVVRHPLVQKIVQAYENYEAKQAKNKTKSVNYRGRIRTRE